MKRPGSLAEVARSASDSTTFWYDLMDFLDEVRRVRDPAMLSEEPERLGDRLEEGEVLDAYLAAVAVAVSRELEWPPPRWTRSPSRTLHRPWFAHPGAALRATLLAESPAAFRERNLFVSANALSRA